MIATKIIEIIGIKKNLHKIHATAKISQLADIEDGVIIGKNSVIESFVKIKEGTTIGDDCIIKSGTSIGHSGFGFERNTENIPLEFPQLGRVFIGNNVQIGANNTVARGSLNNTIINDNVKIDDHCHIAHNVSIGQNAIICPYVDILGSVEIEDNCYLAPNAVILNGVKIGRHAFIGSKSYVEKDVPSGVLVFGTRQKLRKFGKNDRYV